MIGHFLFIDMVFSKNIEFRNTTDDMVVIPSGKFKMGCNQFGPMHGAPEHLVYLNQFMIDRFEVTNKRFEEIIPDHKLRRSKLSNCDECPVTNVSWYEAADYCYLTGKALPTEAQWEKAAGNSDGCAFPWGYDFDPIHSQGRGGLDMRDKSVPVGTYPANKYGIYDMGGNVWEWVADNYSPYKGSTYQSKYFGGELKVLRGQSAKDIGHFSGTAYLSALKMFARSGYRESSYPDQPALDVGFRCASEKMPKAMKLANLSASTRAKSLIKSSSMEKTVTSNTSLSSNNEKVTLQSNPFEVKSNLPSSGMLVLIFLAFTAGVFSFLSPCTLPILPAYFAVTAQADRARMGFMSVAFFLGLASLFVGMGASASYFGGLLREYMFSLTTTGGVVVVVFGIMTLFGKGFSGANFQGRPASTFIGFFLFGATFALGWTPCVGPILSGILILAASDKTIFQGMALLFFYAVGLGLPLILIATLCGSLPKDGLFWKVLRGKGWNLTLVGHSVSLHSTNIFSGLLLIILGIALTMGYITYINSLIPIEIQIWFSGIEETFLHLFTSKGEGGGF
mgnify:CR=1 FL=1